MLYIGMDFGSTYTTISVYMMEKEKLEALTLSEGGTPFIPSVLSISKNQISVGREAKMMTMLPHKKVQSFRAFKMMLTENDEKKLEERGFTEPYNPCRVTHDFLETVLKKILNGLNETQIDHLVVGVPEIWNNEITTIDGKTRLRDICRSLPFVSEKGVQIVSEPAAASAFYAYNFKQTTGNNFNGRILLIDYGGGTLDITLTDVEVRPDETGHEGMEIRILYRTGAGENEEGRIGKAGIVYMETLMERAICQAYPDTEVVYDASFYRAVDALETQLQECMGVIKNVFDEYGTDPADLEEDEMDEDDYIFTAIGYKGDYISISYQLMVEVYDEVIRGVLDEKIDEVMDYMEKSHIEYKNHKDESFKVVMVGGFGNYYLVRKQAIDKFRSSSIDDLEKNVILKREDGEKAISLGAALLAANVIRIRNTAPYSIGVCVQDGTGISLTYGLYYNQDIEFNKVYLQRDQQGDYVVILSLMGSINKFIINLRNDERSAMVVYPKAEIQERLCQAITNPNKTAVIGFSLDSSGVISLHVYDYDILEGSIGTQDHAIELTNFRELFDMQKLERAYKNEEI
jgi:molecular chaperone DnaK